MIGFYDYTVILTYISLVISLFGIFQAVHGNALIAICCLALSGLCDMFDGKIARRKKSRTDDEKSFGIQIDSLCDVICFGIFPAIICWSLGVHGNIGFLFMAFYCVCGVIRLAYFNVLEGKRQQEEEGLMKCYHGLPITSMSIILPVLFAFRGTMTNFHFVLLLNVILVVVGLLFITDFKIRKPKNRTLAFLVGMVAIAIVIAVTFGWKHRKAKMPPELVGGKNEAVCLEDRGKL